MNLSKKISPRVVILTSYATLVALWIFLSDSFLLSIVNDTQSLTSYQSYKGWAFTLFTTFLLYILLLWYERKVLKTTEAKQAIESRFNLLYKDAPNPYQSLDINGNIMAVNQQWLDLLGYSKEEIIGMWFGDILTGKSLTFFENNFTRFKENGSIRDIEYEMKHKDGHIIPIVIHGQIAFDKDPSLLRTHCTFEDITHKQKVEHLNKVLALIRNVNQAIVRIKNCDALLQESCDILISSDLYDYAWITINSVTPLKIVYGAKHKEDFKEFQNKLDTDWTPSCVDILGQELDNNYVYMDNTKENCTVCPLKGKGDLQENGYILALKHKDIEYGYLNVASFSEFDEDELELLQEVAGDIAYALFNIAIQTTLLENEERYRFAIEGTQDGLWDWDIAKGSLYFSPRYKEILGYADDELESSFDAWESRLHPDDKQKALLDIEKSHKNQIKLYSNIHRLKHKDGHWVWVHDRGQTLFDEAKNATRMIGSLSDITEFKKIESALEVSNEKFQKAFNYTPNIIIITNLNTGKIYDINKTFENIFGYTREELIDKTTFDINLWHSLSDRENYIQEFKEFGHVDGKIYSFNTHANAEIIIKVYASLVTIDAQEYILAVAEDITENSKLDNLLQLSQAISHLGSWELDNLKDTLLWSDEVYRIFELDRKEGASLELFLNRTHPDEREIVMQSYNKSIEEHSKYYIEHRLLFADGRIKYVKEQAQHFYDNNNQHIYSIGIVQDITDKKNYIKELEQKKRELESTIKNAPNPIMIHTEDGKIKLLNQAWSDYSGYSIDDTPTIKSWLEKIFDKQEKRDSIQAHIDTLYSITEKVNEGEYTFLNKSREFITWQFSSAPLGLIDTKRTVITTAMDITEIKSKDAMLINQSRHAAMGEMISMIAHQWRQPLSTISMEANNMLLDIELNSFNPHTTQRNIDNIIKQTQHLSHTIDDFRNFFKPDRAISNVNLKDVFQQTLSIVKDSLHNNNIKIECSFETQKEVPAYPRELMQVFVNIITNAKDALHSNAVETPWIKVRVYEDSSYINIEICDNGGGIDVEIIPQIFEPYFSTKDERTGTGLGLYMSKMIIEEHLHGRLLAFNKESGACFRVSLLF